MKKITRDEILDIATYERARPDMRTEAMATKSKRRISVGDKITLLFENRITVRNQIHEMMRAERIVFEEAIEEEIEIYNEIMPNDGGLAATMFIEIPELEDVQPVLDTLLGIDECVSIDVDGVDPVTARPDTRQRREDRISAVHYIQFPFTEEQHTAISDLTTRAKIRVEHKHLSAAANIPNEMRRELLFDLE